MMLILIIFSWYVLVVCGYLIYFYFYDVDLCKFVGGFSLEELFVNGIFVWV